MYISITTSFTTLQDQTQWNQFIVPASVTPPKGSNIPSPSSADKDLQIKGNLIWNGPPVSSALSIFGEDGVCSAQNPTCSEKQILAWNSINKIEPQFVNAQSGNFIPRSGGSIYMVKSVPIPSLTGADRPRPPLAPGGNINNSIQIDYNQKIRTLQAPPGAIE